MASTKEGQIFNCMTIDSTGLTELNGAGLLLDLVKLYKEPSTTIKTFLRHSSLHLFYSSLRATGTIYHYLEMNLLKNRCLECATSLDDVMQLTVPQRKNHAGPASVLI